MPSLVLVAATGGAIGLLIGFFGVGGSSIATPLLSLIGVPPLIAVASPLPATIPAAAIAAIPYFRHGEARLKAAAWTLAGAVPASIAGALASRVVGGAVLLVASGIVLSIVGVRVALPIAQSVRDIGAQRRLRRPLLVMASAGVGLFTGLLANGGGFLLVPLYLLVFGLRMRQAAGTSLLVISVLALPTLATHWALGHVDWAVAASFGAGLMPTSAIGSSLAHRIEGPTLRRWFGVFLVVFGTGFTGYRSFFVG